MNSPLAPVRRIHAPAAAPTGQILTTAEVAEKLRVPVGTLRYWRHNGEGPRSFKLGRSVRYYASDVEAYIDAQYNQTDRTR